MLSRFGLGLGGVTRGQGGGANADAVITALSLWSGGAGGGWHDATDRTTIYQTSDTSTPALADGDPVQRISDKSPNARHWIAAAANNRGALSTIGGVQGVTLDGVDDGYGSNGTLGNSYSVYYAINRRTDTSWALGHSPGGVNLLIALAQSSGSASSLNAGTPTIRVNGVAIGTTRTDLLNACPANTPVVITYESLTIGAAAWGQLGFGTYGGLEFAGQLIAEITCPNQSAENRAIIEAYLAAKAGITI